MTYMVVINHSDKPITIPAGTVVGQSIRHKTRDYVTSNDEGVSRLEFKVHAPKDVTGRSVTEETLKERGLDLSNCRDLGAPGAPLLNEEQRQRLVDQWVEIEQVIAVDPKCPGTSDYMLVRLNTGDHPPQASKPYSIPYAYQELVRKEIEKLLKYNLISPCTSAWASPVLVIVKKDQTGEVANIKLATDVRKLNAVTEMDAGAIGDMSEIVEKFNGKPYASCCDVASGYYSFLVRKEDRCKLSFVLPMSVGGAGTTFCWNRAPYGIALMPAQFSRAMMSLFAGLHEDVSSYIDDLTLHTSTFEGHLQALRAMCRRLIMANVQLKGSKCLILQPSLELLGFDITPEGIRMQAKKCKEWADYPRPSNRKELHTFLGGVAWYRKWMEQLSTITAPLSDLLKAKVVWKWEDRHEAAFQTLLEFLSSD
mgnify:CR=1 FL=1